MTGAGRGAGARGPKGPQVPASTLKRIQVRAGDASYCRTRVPLGYRYGRWQQSGGKLVITFKHGSSANRFRFEVERLPRGMECDLQGSFLRTLQTDGNKVYHRGEAGEWIAHVPV
jgi:hypothetical protein